jgi:hypothetical protein
MDKNVIIEKSTNVKDEKESYAMQEELGNKTM